MNQIKTIKRYQNRKLYDTHESKYVTLEQIARMIRDGVEICVIDNKTQSDITAGTLTQLLYESERKTTQQAPVSLLKEIIRTGDGTFSGYIFSNLPRGIETPESKPALDHSAILNQ